MTPQKGPVYFPDTIHFRKKVFEILQFRPRIGMKKTFFLERKKLSHFGKKKKKFFRVFQKKRKKGKVFR